MVLDFLTIITILCLQTFSDHWVSHPGLYTPDQGELALRILGNVQARCCKVIEETQVEPLLVLERNDWKEV